MKKKFTLKKVFWIGDSIFVHYRPYLVQYLQGLVEIENRNGYRQALEDLDHPRGMNCGDSSMVLSFLKVVLASPDFSTDLIVINCGLHDIKTGPETGQKQVAIAEYIQNLRGIVELMREYGHRLIWVSTTPVDDLRHQTFCPEVHRHQSDVLSYNDAANEVMRNENVPVIDLHRFTASLGDDLYMDHVHYNENVRSLQASYLSGHLERLLLSGEDLEAGFEECTRRRRIILLGDSTVAKLRAGSGTKGWGQALRALFPDWEVLNLAVSGASSKSYLLREEYLRASSQVADFWLIQFGHNDMKEYDPARFAAPAGDYRANLLTMIQQAKVSGAQPVLVTSPHRLTFETEGELTKELLPYVEVVRELGQSSGVPVIDLYAMSGDLMQGFGLGRSQWITATEQADYAHFSEFGAPVIAALVAKELKAII